MKTAYQSILATCVLGWLTTACVPILQGPGGISGTSSGLTDLGVDNYDGSANAPAGSAQYSTLLSGYTISPNWKVAGVNFATGIPSTTTLKDPATINMAGVTVDTSTGLIVVTNAPNTVFDGYDFTAGIGYQMSFVNSPYAAIKNSNLAATAIGESLISADANSYGLYVGYSVIDGRGNSGALIEAFGSAAVIEYNWLKNSGGDSLDLLGGGQLLIQYNLFDEAGVVTAGDYLKLGPASYSNIQIIGNVTIQSTTAVPAQTGAQGFVLDAGAGTITTASVLGNTMTAVGPTTPVVPMSSFVAVNPSSVAQATVSSNYFDPTGATQVFATETASTNIQYSGNYNMVTGIQVP